MIVDLFYGVVGSKADMPRGVFEHFEHLIVGRAHAVCVLCPLSTRPIIGLSPVPWAKSIALRFALLVPFLAKSVRSSSVVVMLFWGNRLLLLRSCHSVRQMCCRHAILGCWRCSFGSNMMVLLSVLCEMGLGIEEGSARVVVGALDTESMVNGLFVVVKTGGVILCF